MKNEMNKRADEMGLVEMNPMEEIEVEGGINAIKIKDIMIACYWNIPHMDGTPSDFIF